MQEHDPFTEDEEDSHAQFLKAQERDDWVELAGSKGGRRLLRGLLRSFRVGQTIWVPDEADLHFRCGRQSAGLSIVDKVREHAPEMIPLLLQDDEQ